MKDDIGEGLLRELGSLFAASGGRAVRDKYGREYLRELGKRGGQSVREQAAQKDAGDPTWYYRAMGRLGAKARWSRDRGQTGRDRA